MHLTKHLTRQAVDVINKDKNARSAPVNIAPIMLVATNSIAKRTIANKIAPKMPVSRVDRIGHRQLSLVSEFCAIDAERRVIAR